MPAAVECPNATFGAGEGTGEVAVAVEAGTVSCDDAVAVISKLFNDHFSAAGTDGTVGDYDCTPVAAEGSCEDADGNRIAFRAP